MKNINNLNNYLWAAIGVALLVNIAVLFQSTAVAKDKVAAAEELARPANISFISIKDSSCADCAGLEPYTTTIRKMKVNITGERTIESGSDEGKKFIADFGIKRVPTLIIQGELDRATDLGKLLPLIGKIEKDTFVLTTPDASAPLAPYVDLATGQVKGRVGLILISDKSCKECPNAEVFRQAVAGAGIINPEDKGLVDIADAEGKKLVNKYKITSVPTFILTGEVGEYTALVKDWSKLGTVEKDGAYVFRELKIFQGLTYYDLKTNAVVKPEASKTPAASPAPTGSPAAK